MKWSLTEEINNPDQSAAELAQERAPVSYTPLTVTYDGPAYVWNLTFRAPKYTKDQLVEFYRDLCSLDPSPTGCVTLKSSLHRVLGISDFVFNKTHRATYCTVYTTPVDEPTFYPASITLSTWTSPKFTRGLQILHPPILIKSNRGNSTNTSPALEVRPEIQEVPVYIEGFLRNIIITVDGT